MVNVLVSKLKKLFNSRERATTNNPTIIKCFISYFLGGLKLNRKEKTLLYNATEASPISVNA